MSRCSATTKSGERCRLPASRGDLCTVHAPAATDGKRGRPRSESRAALALSQRDKVDQQATRELRRIRQLLAKTLDAEDAGRVWAEEIRRITERLNRVPEELARQLLPCSGAEETEALLLKYVHALLKELAEGGAAPQQMTTEPPDPPERLAPSENVTAARARLNQIQARHLDLQERLEAGTARWRTGWRPWHEAPTA